MKLTKTQVKTAVKAALQGAGITTPAKVESFLTETRCLDNSGHTVMRSILASLAASNQTGWVSRRQVRHYAKELLKEGAL